MIFFTADLHFYHENVIKHAQRPFANATEMNETLIRNWNQTVSSADEVYILGDVTMKGAEQAARVLSRLNGHKHLIRGNHDKFAEQKSLDTRVYCQGVLRKKLPKEL